MRWSYLDGQVVLLTHLREGQQATVLQLPAQSKTAHAVQSPGASHDTILWCRAGTSGRLTKNMPLAQMH